MKDIPRMRLVFFAQTQPVQTLPAKAETRSPGPVSQVGQMPVMPAASLSGNTLSGETFLPSVSLAGTATAPASGAKAPEESANAPLSGAWWDFWRHQNKKGESWYNLPTLPPVPTPEEIRIVGISQLPPNVWDYAYHHSPYNTWSPSHEIHHQHPKFF